jgi:hypothetical protein
MIRFTYDPKDLDPRDLHRHFLRAGARPHLYSYRPRHNVWSLTMEDHREGVIVREVMDRLGIDYDEAVVPSRFAQAEAD